MKRIIAALIVLLLASSAFAARPFDPEDHCQTAGKYAATVVQLRDLGNGRDFVLYQAAIVSSGSKQAYEELSEIVNAIFDDYTWHLTPERAQDLVYSACIGQYKKVKKVKK